MRVAAATAPRPTNFRVPCCRVLSTLVLRLACQSRISGVVSRKPMHWECLCRSVRSCSRSCRSPTLSTVRNPTSRRSARQSSNGEVLRFGAVLTFSCTRTLSKARQRQVALLTGGDRFERDLRSVRDPLRPSSPDRFAQFHRWRSHDAPMPLDYFVWAIVGTKRSFIFDTGFDVARAAKRDRTLLRPVGEGLRMIGLDPDKVEDVIISHMHFDHSGNHALFPNARYHVQDDEMKYCTGRCMCHHALRTPFELDDVTDMVGKIFAGPVTFHDGTSELAPNLTIHKVGGHSKGLQIVRIMTRR